MWYNDIIKRGKEVIIWSQQHLDSIAMYAEAISMKARCIRQKTQTSCYRVKFVAKNVSKWLQQNQDIRKEEDNMRKQNENTKTKLAGSIYGQMAMKEANKNIKHMTVDEFIEAMKPESTTCNICGIFIPFKEAMMPCGPYRSEKTRLYVCTKCYKKHVKPRIKGLLEMAKTIDRNEYMKELEYRY